MTAIKMKNLNKALFQRALVFTSDIEDETIKHLQPKYKITIKQIEIYFNKMIKIWNKTFVK